LKENWISRAFTSRVQRRNGSLPEETWKLENWRSWAHEAYNSFDKRTNASRDAVRKLIIKKMEHGGELFGLPEEDHAAPNSRDLNFCRDPFTGDVADLTTSLAAHLILKFREDTEKYLINTIEREGVGYFKGYLHGDVSLRIGDMSLVPAKNAVDELGAEGT
jgi:hypothetical protein